MTTFSELRSDLQRQIMAGMPEHIARLSWQTNAIKTRQQAALRRLVANAKTHSPFYRRRLAHIDPATIMLDDLRDIPTITKHEIMQNFDELVTDRRISRALAEAALAATSDEPKPLPGGRFAMATGGSSGERGVFVFDREAVVQIYSALVRWSARASAQTGSIRAAFVAAGSAVHSTAFGVSLTQGGRLPLEFTPVPATLPISEIVAKLNALQPGGLFGYPSMLYRLAAEAEAKRLTIAPKIITCTAETLGAEQRQSISSTFNAPVTDTFGSTEGLIGVSAPNDSVLVFNSDLCIIELVDDDNRPVPMGTPSAKVLMTNLSNLIQPLIRYEMNDCFVQQPFAAEHGHLRAIVEGRADELLHYGGVDVHPLAVRGVMVKTPGVLDYQVTQTACGIDVAVLAEVDVDLPRLRQQLVDALRNAGLAQPEVNARRTSALERNAYSGKLRRFIPLKRAA
ncbi:MAG: AMP-binding protein [Alphaproteobacteria bacterium]|nr:AMP-binding protein [Alphaproteobacteria bacterium]